jgi:hypothetical protein
MRQPKSKEYFFDKAHEVLILAQKLSNRVGGQDVGREGDFDTLCKEGGAYKFLACLFLLSATEGCDTTFLLLEKGLIDGAFLAVRRLLELYIDLRFIGLEPEGRAKQFIKFEPIQEATSLKIKEKYFPGVFEISEEQRNLILSKSEDAMEDLGYKDPPRRWSPRYDYSAKCRKIDSGKQTVWEKQYHTLYKFCCDYTHPSPRGMNSHLTERSDGNTIYDSPVEMMSIIAVIAINALLDIVFVANRTLNAGMNKQIDRFYKNLGKQGWVKL